MQLNMKQLVPIRIVLGSRIAKDGTMPIAYPDFNKLEESLRGGIDWSYFIDREGFGMHYSKHQGTTKKPACCWTLVPKSFAEAAAKVFAEVTIHTEEEWAEFYDNDCKSTAPTEHLDVEQLQGILARVQLEKLGIAPSPSKEIQELRKQCLDPECDLPGISKNHRKTWALAKKLTGVEII